MNILTGKKQCSEVSRILAKSIDFLIGAAVFFLLSPASFFVALLAVIVLTVFQDCLISGQSLGKKLIGLQVRDLNNAKPCTPKQSFIRNFPFVVLVTCALIPFLWLFLIIVALPWVILELYLVWNLETGIRVGDVLANTYVLDAHPVESSVEKI